MKDNVVPQQAFTMQAAKEDQKTKVFFGFFKFDMLCNDCCLHKSKHYTVYQCICNFQDCNWYHLPISLLSISFTSFSLTVTKKKTVEKKNYTDFFPLKRFSPRVHFCIRLAISLFFLFPQISLYQERMQRQIYHFHTKKCVLSVTMCNCCKKLGCGSKRRPLSHKNDEEGIIQTEPQMLQLTSR